MFLSVFLVALLSNYSNAQLEVWRPRSLGTTPLNHAAFIELIPSENPTINEVDNYTLYVSNFDALLKDDILYLRSPGRILDNVANWTLTVIDNTNEWPNEVIQMPSSVIGIEGIVWTSGFLVPRNTKGRLNIYLTATDPLDGPYNIARLDDQEWAYHALEWYDVNHDGLLDAVSARFRIVGGANYTQLVWFENPGQNAALDIGWNQSVIFEAGADVNFVLCTINVNAEPFLVLIAAEFWNERLTIYYAADGSDSFLSDPLTLEYQIIDDTVGRAFDVQYEDLNLDGKPEILLSAFNKTEGNVLTYLVPNDFRTEPFERKIIASGFIPNNIDSGTMSPGNLHSYYKDLEHENSGLKPYVMVSGDDDGNHYILTAQSEDPNDWLYDKHTFIETNGSIAGDFALADLDNDGYMEVISLGYSSGLIYVHTYSP